LKIYKSNILEFCFMLRTYKDDFDYAKRLILSFNRHNTNNLRLFIIVSIDDLNLFSSFNNKNITIMSDELLNKYFTKHYVKDIRPGYINQEIVKLSFWELGIAKHYFALDSDFVFLKNFNMNTFFTKTHQPKYVLVDDKELMIEPEYFNNIWKKRQIELNKIKRIMKIKDNDIKTCHGGTIITRAVMKSFKEKFMEPNNLTYLNLLTISPYEFTWYNYWLQKNKKLKIQISEPYFKIYHNYDQIRRDILMGITNESIKNSYVGIVINSNFSRAYGLQTLTRNREAVIAQSLNVIMIIKIIYFKIRQLKPRLIAKFRLFKSK
jgi:hypothetical protein